MILEVEIDKFGAYADIEVNDLAKKAGFKVLSIREPKRFDNGFRPCGVNQEDTLKNSLKRADQLSSNGSYSGILCGNKDLRRIVLLAHHVRTLEKDLANLNKQIIE